MKIIVMVVLIFFASHNMSEAGIFAEVKDNNTVGRVIIADSEEWCQRYLGGRWIETFMDNPNKNYASKGYNYYEIYDDFATPRPYPSWVLGEGRKWVAPVAMAKDGKRYKWNESIINWEEVIVVAQ